MRTNYPRARLLTVLAIAVLGASCAPARSPTGSANTVPSATASGPTSVPTPVPAADLVVTRELVFAWEDPPGSSNISYQVIVEFKNQGTGWAQTFRTSRNQPSILDPSGSVTESGQGFLQDGYPEFVGPGESGYMILNSIYWSGAPGAAKKKVSDFATVEFALGPGSLPGVQMPGSVSCQCFRSVAPSRLTFEVSGIAWRSDGSHRGLLASGSVTASSEMIFAAVAVLCVGTDGSILGATTQLLQGHLLPNRPTSFQTADNTQPLKPSDCATSVGLLGRGIPFHLGGD